MFMIMLEKDSSLYYNVEEGAWYSRKRDATRFCFSDDARVLARHLGAEVIYVVVKEVK